MTRIRNYNRLEPAYTIIVTVGLAEMAALTGLDERTVRRWAKPRATGGTGGTIPAKYQMLILEHARRKGLAISEASFFPRGGARPRPKKPRSKRETKLAPIAA